MRLLCFLTLFILCSCTTLFSYSDPSMQIQKGMNAEAVLKLMGEPQYRSFVGDAEEWVYQRATSMNAEIKVIVVTLMNGRVDVMDSFPQAKYPMPQPPIVVHNPPVYMGAGGPHYPNNKIEPMDHEAFESLYNNVKKKPFKKDQMELLKIGVSNCYLTCNQAARLMSIFSFDNEKLDLLRVLAPKIIDRENFTKVVDALSFLSSRETAQKIMADTSPSQVPGKRKVMSSEAFSAFCDQIKKKPFKDDKLEILRIGSAGNYFTCGQCVGLMSTCSFDDEKLDVLRIVAPRVVDRENFMTIIDSLSFLSSQEEAKKILSI